MRVELISNMSIREVITIQCNTCGRTVYSDYNGSLLFCVTKTCPNYMYSMTNKGERDVASTS